MSILDTPRPPFRIAVGSIFIECNHLGGVPTTIEFFERSELRVGSDMLDLHSGTIGGMLHEMGQHSVEVRPLLVATACPSGPLTAECYDHLKRELLERLQQTLPVDGVLLALHGSASADNAGDVEGDLLLAVRKIVGPNTRIVGTLDLHAHVTGAMVQAANALVAWETYPHRDAFETGQRGARMLLGTLNGEFKPTMALAKAPVVVGGVHSGTDDGAPFADVMHLAKSIERQPGILSTSAFLVHPYLDLPDMGGGGLVITDNDDQRAGQLAREIAEYYWTRRFDLEPEVFAPGDAIRMGQATDGGPVLLAEVADCCGGGAAGDSVYALKALLDSEVNASALVPVVDPVAADACHNAGVGSDVTIHLGHALDSQWGDPVQVSGTVRHLSTGRFRYSGGIYAGQQGEMGPSAVLQVGQVQILITTYATYDWADEQFRAADLDPTAAKFVVVKNPMNFRVGYAGLYKACYILDTPGSTPATLRNVQFRNLKRPYFPADADIPGFEPKVVFHVESLTS